MIKPMTVRQLAEALAALPEEQQEWPVKTEGCDCYGDAGALLARPANQHFKTEAYVVVLRTDEGYDAYDADAQDVRREAERAAR